MNTMVKSKWNTIYTDDVIRCPKCNTYETESKGKRQLSTAMSNKRVCHNCQLYYYWREDPIQVFYSIID